MVEFSLVVGALLLLIIHYLGDVSNRGIFVQGGLKFFVSFPLGPENPLKSIDFTGPGGD